MPVIASISPAERADFYEAMEIGKVLLLGALGQLAHFVGHDGETAALLSCARGLDCRIERQQVGLLGDLADLARHRADGGGRIDEGVHRLDHVLYGLADMVDFGDQVVEALLSGG